MKKLILLIPFLSCFNLLISQNSAPNLTDVQLSHDAANRLITLTFDLLDVESDTITIVLQQSAAGDNFVPVTNATGDFGFPILIGNSKSISWQYDAGTDLSKIKLKLMAYDRHAPSIADMVALVSQDSLKSNLEAIVGVRHYTAAPAKLAEVENYISNKMSAAGLTQRNHSFMYNNKAFNNIIGQKEGLYNNQLCLINGHFDSASNAPGADDNGTGVVGVLEAMRVLKDYSFENNIQFTNFNLEELGLIGSSKYVTGGIKAGDKIKGLVNYEMIGYSSEEPNSQTIPNGFEFLFPTQVTQIISDQSRGNFIINCGNTASGALNTMFNLAAGEYVPSLKVISLVVPGTGTIAQDLRRSDHAPFWDAGFPALMITDGADTRNHNYHTAQDVLSTINFEFLTKVAAAGIATIATLAKPINATSETFDLATLSSKNIVKPAFELNIYPNPVKEILSFQIKGLAKEQFLQVNIVDSKGAIVIEKNEKFNSNVSLTDVDVSKLAPGPYLLKIGSGQNAITSRFIIGK